MDTNKMRDISREQFEKFALSAEGGLFADHLAKGEDGEYLNYAVRCYWLFWQASRESVVVELPPRKSIDHYCYDQGANCNAEGHNQCLAQAAAAIEAQGLKVAP